MTEPLGATQSRESFDHTLVGDRVLLRVHVTEAARHAHALLYEAIVELLRTRGIAGATVLRGLMGFGRRRFVHGPMNEISSISMPIVVDGSGGRGHRARPRVEGRAYADAHPHRRE